jgi:hypothetical protein
MDSTGPKIWLMPIAWCAVTTLIIASGLAVPMAGGPGAAGFGYVFEAVGYGQDFMSGLALYSAAAAGLGVAFMFTPKVSGWRFSRGLAWSTFLLMAIGGALMLVAPRALLALAAGSGERATSLAQVWSIVWIDAGTRISIAGVLVAIATFVDAYLRRHRVH